MVSHELDGLPECHSPYSRSTRSCRSILISSIHFSLATLIWRLDYIAPVRRTWLSYIYDKWMDEVLNMVKRWPCFSVNVGLYFAPIQRTCAFVNINNRPMPYLQPMALKNINEVSIILFHMEWTFFIFTNVFYIYACSWYLYVGFHAIVRHLLLLTRIA